MTCVIVEDEKLLALSLEKMVKEEGLEVLGISTDLEEAVELIDKLKPDILFLDINLGRSDGFEILRRITHMPYIIFTTAYSEYAVRAFEENAIDYLLKPIKKERLKIAIEKVKKMNDKNYSGKISEILNVFSTLSSKSANRIPVETAGEIYFIDPDDIVYLQSEEKNTLIFLKDEVLKTRQPLKDIETKLPSKDFVRVHKSYIVAIKCIRKILKNYFGSMAIEMTNRKIIPVGRNYKGNLKNIIGF